MEANLITPMGLSTTGESLILSSVTLLDGDTGDLYIRDGKIIETAASTESIEVDCRGWVAIPGLTDAHVHLDKTLWGVPWQPHVPTPDVRERIRMERDLLTSPHVPAISVRASALIATLVSNGVTSARSHVDVSPLIGLSRVEAMLEVRRRFLDVIDLSLVAFPQEGIISVPGTYELIDEALQLGVDVVGGIDPEVLDGDRSAHLDAVFALAQKNDAIVDIHVHEPGSVGAKTLQEIAERTVAIGLQQRVNVSHCFALGQIDDYGRDQLVHRLAEAGISLVSNLPGRGLMPPIQYLLEKGLNVAVASDNVRDSWSPHGKADPLERAALASHLLGWKSDSELVEALHMVSRRALLALGRPVIDFRPGCSADLALVSATCVQEAIVTQPPERVVLRRGRVVAKGGTLTDPELLA